MTPALLIHVAAGGVGIVAGAAALVARKGRTTHRRSGTVFALSMLAMAAMAVLLSVTLPDWSNLPGGLFVAYLVATGWMTVRPPPPTSLGRTSTPLVWVLGVAAAGLAAAFASVAARAPDGLFWGKPMPLYAVFCMLALFALAMDLRTGARASGKSRAARHAWRMGVALFFATGSFFLGQQKVMPAWLQGSPVLLAAAVAPLLLTMGWLLRIQLSRNAGFTAVRP